MLKILIIPILLITTYFYIIPEKGFTREEMQLIEKLYIVQPSLTVQELIKVKGAEYHVSTRLMEEIINCESQGSTTVQSRHKYPTNKYAPAGTREQSFGLVQIHLPAHKNITKEQAIDPVFATDFLAKNLKAGKGRMWSCYPIALKRI